MKIFRFVKKVYFVGLTILSSFTNTIPLKCISVKNQECKTSQELMKQDLYNGMKLVSVNVD